jgi:hypothetical protein
VSVIAAIAAAWTLAASDAGPVSASSADPETAADAAPAPGVDAPDQQASIRAAFDAAETLQGPLDGLWRLEDGAGRTLFIFDLVDPGGSPAPLSATPDNPEVEGAWRDPRGPRSPDSSGFVDSVRSDGRWVQIRFVGGPDRRGEVVTLKAGGKARWTGMLDGAGAPQAVVMIRF